MSSARASLGGGQDSSQRKVAGNGEDDGEQGDDDDAVISPLFVDGIGELVDYHRVRSLFAEHGRLRNVFVQRVRKLGHKFRFGFVRFFSRKYASKAISALNGTKCGGAMLRIGWARSSLKGTSEVNKDSMVTKEVRSVSSTLRSWRDVVMGRPPGGAAKTQHGVGESGAGK